MSERLGMSFSGAKSRVQRARGKMKDALEECCDFELDRRGNILDYAPKSPGSPPAAITTNNLCVLFD